MLRLFFTQDVDAHDLLRRSAGLVWGMEGLPDLDRAPRGKPFFHSMPQYQFNLSHSGPYALCALSDGEVGADIEVVRPRRPFLPKKVLSETEFAWFQDRGNHWEDFYTLWTLKEARVKYTGTGLTVPARDIAVPLLDPGQHARLDGLTFTAYAGEGWRAALCAAETGPLIECIGDS
ncbi:4'-phosphopantetheinyl transferase family protein [Intestinimonas timonensis]|uniref:4'-phosphopantetheinyl transferase family protein n=1 Tax=Intestinimonas timonensis TaxID=1689270 RepID=UPI001031C7EA|nr:4'-phosphopantetheinyl transferase superfamily protein [Intestinimonas timonensis]